MEIKNLGQLIQHFATKAGIASDDKNLINLLSNAELTKIPLHSDLVKSLDENLLSLEAATDNHPTIGAKYKAQALNAFDKKMQALMDEFEFDEEAKSEISGIQSSYKRFESLTAKIKELNNSKASASNKGDKDALQKQIDDLQAKLKAATEALPAKEAEFTAKLNNLRTDYLFKNKFSGKKTVFDQLPEDVKHASLMTIINKAIQDNDASVTYDENGNASLLKKDGSKLYGANHTLITLDDLIDNSLAQNKVLVVSQQQQAPAAGQQQQQQQNGHQVIPGGNPSAVSGTNQSVVDFNRQQRESIASGTEA